jgi:hypothetical protein
MIDIGLGFLYKNRTMEQGRIQPRQTASKERGEAPKTSAGGANENTTQKALPPDCSTTHGFGKMRRRGYPILAKQCAGVPLPHSEHTRPSPSRRNP